MIKLKIDDPLDASPVHGFCGAWGVLAVGLFDKTDGVFYGGNGKLLGWQILGIFVIFTWTTSLCSILFLLLKIAKQLRISEYDEIRGLDSKYHGGSA